MTIQIDGKSVAIGVLTLGAIILGLAHLGSDSNRATSGTDHQRARNTRSVTARVAQGGDGLYLVDNRTGLMAVFTYDPPVSLIEAPRSQSRNRRIRRSRRRRHGKS